MLLSLLLSLLLIPGPMSKKNRRAAALLSRVERGFKLVNSLAAVLLSLLQLTVQCNLTTTTTMNTEASAVLLNPRLLLLRLLLHLRHLVPRLLLLRPLLHLHPAARGGLASRSARFNACTRNKRRGTLDRAGKL